MPPNGADKYARGLLTHHQRRTLGGGPPRAEVARPAASAYSSKTLLHSDRGCIRRLDEAVHSAFREETPARAWQRRGGDTSERPCRTRQPISIDTEPVQSS